MICYRDRTYCTFHEGCQFGTDCDRALTQEVFDKACKWWGSKEPPFAIFTNQPTCFQNGSWVDQTEV